MRTAIILISALLSGCMSAVHKQRQACLDQNLTLAGTVACVKAGLPTASKNDDLYRLYVAYSDAVLARVQNGSMSEVDARLALEQEYYQIKQTDKKRVGDKLTKLGNALQKAGKANRESSQSIVAPTPIRSGAIFCEIDATNTVICH